MTKKPPESYFRLKKYAKVVEEICKDIDLRGFGYEPGVMFRSPDGHSLDLPEWFLERLHRYTSHSDARAGSDFQYMLSQQVKK